MSDADEILEGERTPSRAFAIDAAQVRAVRKLTGLSPLKFADILHVEVSTLRHWAQGRRGPAGPARALLRVIRKNPRDAIRALAAAI